MENSIKDTESFDNNTLGSDHLPVVSKVEIRFAKTKTTTKQNSLSRTISPEDIPLFNDQIREQLSEHSGPVDIDNWDDAVWTAAQTFVPEKKNTPKKPWITQDTLNLIRHKHSLEHTNNSEAYKLARKTSAKAVKTDWENWLAKTVDTDLELRDKDWELNSFAKITSPNYMKNRIDTNN